MKKTGSILEVQPAFCRLPLPIKEESQLNLTEFQKKQGYVPKYLRVLFYDPTEFYKAHHSLINPFSRHNTFKTELIYPRTEDPGLCKCGCGQKRGGRRLKYATGECSTYGYEVRYIIAGYTDTVYKYLKIYYGESCAECRRTPEQIEKEDGYESNRALKVDHIHPVKLGGGGSWLPNYQLLCHKCHVPKTCEDFGWKQKQPNSQLPLL